MKSPTFMAINPLCFLDGSSNSYFGRTGYWRPVMSGQAGTTIEPGQNANCWHTKTGLEPWPRARHIAGMNQRRPPEIDMTIEGEFVSPPTAPISNRILLWAIIVAVMAGALTLAAFALWLALFLLPLAVGASVVAWGMYRYRLWREQKSLGGQGPLWRP
jgi:hypothetical protein